MMRRPARGGLAAAFALVTLVAVVSCGDPFTVRNKYDPAYPVTFSITGPDSLFNLGDVGTYSATTDPPFPDTAFLWAVDTATTTRLDGTTAIVDGATIFTPSTLGSFISVAPPLYPATATVLVAALVGSVDTTEAFQADSVNITVHTVVPRHIGYKAVVVTQRVVHIQLRCPDVHMCDTVAVGDTLSVWVDGLDARGSQIIGLRTPTTNFLTGPPIAVYAIRDSTIASLAPVGIRAATVTALHAGTTWVVGTRGSLSDSVQVVVH